MTMGGMSLPLKKQNRMDKAEIVSTNKQIHGRVTEN